MPSDDRPDPFPRIYIGNEDQLKTVAEFINFLRSQGNISDPANPRGYLGYWNALTKYGNYLAARDCAPDALHQVKAHPHARELTRLILASLEFIESQIGDGSEAVQKAVDALRDLGYEVTLHRATEQRLAAAKK